MKCIDYGNLIVTELPVTEQYVDPNEYVIHLQSDEINMKAMTKKKYHESLMYEYFSQFISIYKKTYYVSQEANYHYGVFIDNVKYINQLNEKYKGVTVFAINKYTDLTYENFTKWHTGFSLQEAKKIKQSVTLFVQPANYEAAKKIPSIDRTLDPISGYVEKNQGNCSNSYVFAAVRMMELGYRYQVSDYLSRLSLSEQHAFDCTPIGDCNGQASSGNVYMALKETGIMLSEDYPYDDEDPKKGSCKYDSSKFTVKYRDIRSVYSFERITEPEMIAIIHHRAAFTTSIFVPRSMQHYRAGLLIPTECNGQPTNHMIVIGGYGITSNGVKFWTIYNSWGMSWGEMGRFHMVRDVAACGLATEYLAYALLFVDEFPPFADKWPGPPVKENTTEETMPDFSVKTKADSPLTTGTYQGYWLTEEKFTLNSSMITSTNTPIPENDDMDPTMPLYHRPRAQTNMDSNIYVAKAFDRWYKMKHRPREILDSAYLRTSSVLSTPASWEGASKIDYDLIDSVKESDSFYVP